MKSNLEKIFRKNCVADFDEQQLQEILQNNFIEGDALDFFERQTDLFSENKFATLDFAEDFSKAVIIGNPPYQKENTNNNTYQARPIYHYFVEQSKKLNPNFIVMIIPSRWFAGGLGLDNFRNTMMNDKHIQTIVDYTNAKDCFPDNDISGGVCYFVWNKNYNGFCKFISVRNGVSDELFRSLNEFPVLVRYNQAISIIRKIIGKSEKFLPEIVSAISPFGLPTKVRGTAKKNNVDDLKVFSSAGTSFLPYSEILNGFDYIDNFKVMFSQTIASASAKPDKDGKFSIFASSMKVLKPAEVCTHSYLIAGNFAENNLAENLLLYMQTKFLRFLVLQTVSSIHLTAKSFCFVPMQDFSSASDVFWKKSVAEIDKFLYAKYNLSDAEIDFIESKVRAME